MTSVPTNQLLSWEEALALSGRDYLDLYAKHVNSVFVRSVERFGLVRRYVRAEGIHLWDDEGTKYYDFFNGFGCLNLGHNHPNVVGALEHAIKARMPMIHQLAPSRLAAALAHNLSVLLPDSLQITQLYSTGAEAVEASIKLATSYTGRTRLLSTYNGYHGKTLGASSLTGLADSRTPFEPVLDAVQHVPFGDSDAAESELKTKRYAAVVVEPIQGVGGINLPPDDYLSQIKAMCDRYRTLLVLDEVQTGMGRTGAMFAFEHYGIVPDILLLSKSLGGGIMPLSACITSKGVWKKAYGSIKTFTRQTSTFSGNTLACVAGLATVQTLVNEDICRNCAVQGDYLLSGLRNLQTRAKNITSVRGKGLMVGLNLEFSSHNPLSRLSHRLIKSISPKIVTSYVASRLLRDHNIVVSPSLTNDYMLRVYPPLNVTKSEIDYFLRALERVCALEEDYGDILKGTVWGLQRRPNHRVIV